MTDATRDRILLAAGQVFAENGYEAATVRQICAAAEVNHAAINYYFGGKHALYVEAVQLAHRLRYEDVPPPAWDADTPPEEKLRRFISTMLERMLGEDELGWPMQLLTREFNEPTEAYRPLVENGIRPQFERLLSVLDELLPPDVDLSRRVKIALSVIGQCMQYRVGRDFVGLLVKQCDFRSDLDIEHLAEHITDFTLAALETIRRRSSDASHESPPVSSESTLS